MFNSVLWPWDQGLGSWEHSSPVSKGLDLVLETYCQSHGLGLEARVLVWDQEQNPIRWHGIKNRHIAVLKSTVHFLTLSTVQFVILQSWLQRGCLLIVTWHWLMFINQHQCGL